MQKAENSEFEVPNAEWAGGGAVRTWVTLQVQNMGKDKNGQTPLHLIITRGNLKEIQCLLDHNADVNAKDKNGKTPLALFEDLKIQEEGFSHGWLMGVDVKAVEGLLMKYGAQGPVLETKPYSAPSAGTI